MNCNDLGIGGERAVSCASDAGMYPDNGRIAHL
jgi:hypothetical protein